MIVVDTAPTGHALRLLETPDAAREWVQVLLRVLLKYRSLVRPGQLAAELVEALEIDPRAAGAAARFRRHPLHRRHARRRRPARETERLMGLRRLRLAVPAS